MELAPYLFFNGNCAEAFRFYERCLGGRIVMIQTHGESPAKDHVPAAWHDKVIHVRLAVGEQVLMGSDAPAEHFEVPQGFSVSFTVGSRDEAERVFGELTANGKVTMPFGKTFWSDGFGMGVDRFGIPWMVNTASRPQDLAPGA